MRVIDDGFVTINLSGRGIFESTILKAFLVGKFKEGYKYNSLVFGSCDGRLINKFTKKLTLYDAVTESKTGAIVDRPEENSRFEVIRNKFRRYFDQNHNIAASGILRGLVLGDKTGLRKELKDQLIKTGTIHIMVASGFNVILVAGIVLGLLKPFVGKYNAYLFSLIVLVGYVFLTNFEAPIVRAYLMYLMVIGGKLLGRRVRASRSLFLAVLIMIFIQPLIVWEVGFQLSVAATYGLVAIKPVFDRWITRHLPERLLGLLETDLSTTFCAFLATTPILWWHFGRVQLLGMITNLMIGPLVPVLTILGFFEILVNVLHIPLGGMVPIGTEILANIILKILYLF